MRAGHTASRAMRATPVLAALVLLTWLPCCVPAVSTRDSAQREPNEAWASGRAVRSISVSPDCEAADPLDRRGLCLGHPTPVFEFHVSAMVSSYRRDPLATPFCSWTAHSAAGLAPCLRWCGGGVGSWSSQYVLTKRDPRARSFALPPPPKKILIIHPPSLPSHTHSATDPQPILSYPCCSPVGRCPGHHHHRRVRGGRGGLCSTWPPCQQGAVMPTLRPLQRCQATPGPPPSFSRTKVCTRTSQAGPGRCDASPRRPT